MSFPITRPAKNQLILPNPIMPAAGTFGYGNLYRDMVNFAKLGAIVTNPVTYHPRMPANGARVVPLDAGVLVHTGIPNRGVYKTAKRWGDLWRALDVPVIFHLAATTTEDVIKSLEMIDRLEGIVGVELGLPDDILPADAAMLTASAAKHTEKPLLVRIPFYDALALAAPVADAGAGGLVVAAPPRGTARDPHTGKLVGGRLYSPTLFPLALRMVGSIARQITDVPIVGAGGVHSAQNARDFLEAGASAVQVDSLVWVLPRMIEIIARDLGGLVLTKPSDALGDEWFTGISKTDVFNAEKRRRGGD